MSDYKLPICWLGKTIQEYQGTDDTGNGKFVSVVITQDMVNPKCHCYHALQAHFCMEGHMTECHAGMTCSEAECSHYEAEEEGDNYP